MCIGRLVSGMTMTSMTLDLTTDPLGQSSGGHTTETAVATSTNLGHGQGHDQGQGLGAGTGTVSVWYIM